MGERLSQLMQASEKVFKCYSEIEMSRCSNAVNELGEVSLQNVFRVDLSSDQLKTATDEIIAQIGCCAFKKTPFSSLFFFCDDEKQKRKL